MKTPFKHGRLSRVIPTRTEKALQEPKKCREIQLVSVEQWDLIWDHPGRSSEISWNSTPP
jgi:hypothetical protein